MIITIDGPSGTGKSTVARKLADALGMTYFDTGALYRAISWKILEERISYHEKDKLVALLKAFSYRIQMLNGEKHYFVGSFDVTGAIRSPEVTAIVSEVSALEEVRKALKPLQIDFAEKNDVVFEGRDLGTVVFPDADKKFFLVARPEVRAQRRYLELREKFPDQTFSPEETLQEIKLRDSSDSSRKIAPLKQADDAILVDTSDLKVEEVVQKLKGMIQI